MPSAMMTRALLASSVLLWPLAAAQNLSAVQTITPNDVAFLAYNVTAHDTAPFEVYDASFRSILGSSPSLTLLLNETEPYFHEAGVYFTDSPPTIFAVSNQFNTTSPSPATAGRQIVLSKVTKDASTGQWTLTLLNNSESVPLANGGTGYKQGVLFTAQGNLETAGGLVYVNASDPSYPSKFVIDNYLGRQFNSPNDVYVTQAGDIYFTDPQIGYAQNIRPAPRLPPQVYVFRPGTTQVRAALYPDGYFLTAITILKAPSIRLQLVDRYLATPFLAESLLQTLTIGSAVAQGVPVPNGITFSPDEKTAYVTTTPVDGNVAASRAIYAFDVVPQPGNAAPSLENMRVFAFPGVGAPDGIHCDARGNVYAGCGDGINVWSPGGVLLGKIGSNLGTLANFAFAPNGRIFVFDEYRLWLAQLSESVQPSVPPVVEA